jgi:UDP-N-acetylmuramate--alanine ligase
MRHISKIHFVGIGGAGMGGIAEVLLNQGYIISGSDMRYNAMTRRLEELGAKVFIGHRAEQVQGCDVVVVSSAISQDNPELVYAHEVRIPVVQRAEMLAELMRFRQGIAIAGAHGKTTTTSLIASILAQENLDPTFVIGGLLNSIGANARLGTGPYLVAEADESDASFLLLRPMLAVVTNIDADHLSTYGGDFNKLKQAYVQFLHNLPFYGLAVVCVECPNILSMVHDIGRPVLTYGLGSEADYSAYNIVATGLSTEFTVLRKNQEPLAVKLNLAGKHNVLNALAAITVACDLGIKDSSIVAALAEFKGVGRRMQVFGSYPRGDQTVMLVDDYGHHPEEVKVTLQAVRDAFPSKRVVMLFQPHRYSRTAELFDAFAQVLSGADVLIMMEVYAAGETLIPGADSAHLCRHIRQISHLSPILVKTEEELFQTLDLVLEGGDILLTQGAGNVGQVALKLAQMKLQFSEQAIDLSPA